MKVKCLLTTALCVALVLGGCGSSAVENGTSGVSKDENKDESVTLSLMTMFTEEDKNSSSAQAYRKVLEEFKQEYPNIILEEENIAHDAYETKIKTVAQSKSLPDIFIIKGAMVEPFTTQGVIAPVDADLEQNPEWRDSFVEGAFNDFTYKEEIYGFPYEIANGSVIFYNKNIFNECGITEFPKTWNEFTSAVTVIKEHGYTPIALGNKGKWVAQCCIFSTLADRFTGADWFTGIVENNGSSSFTDPEFVSTLKAYEELCEIGAFNEDANSIDNIQQESLYMEGRAAMFFEGSWAISAIDTNATQEIKDATEFGLMPSVEGGKGNLNAVAGGSGWAWTYNMNLSDSKKDAALTFLKYITSEKYGDYAYAFSGQPSVKATLDPEKVTPLFSRYIESIKDATWCGIYDVHLPISVNGEVETGLQEIMIGTSTPEEVAQKVQAEYERVMAK